jgi:signal peptide peptidase SppA
MNRKMPSRVVASARALTGQWLMAEPQLRELVGRVNTTPATMLYDDASEAATPSVDRELDKTDAIAVIPVIGILTKYPTYFDRVFGFTPATVLRATLDQALNDPSVRSIVMLIDTPGGTSVGTIELAEACAAAQARKPVEAIVSDTCASGGYYIASQCRRITANASAFIGCVGVYRVLVDESKLLDDIGIKMTVVSSGGVKGLGEDGTVTPELVADQQREVNSTYELFVNAIARGRGFTVDKARELADGRSWIAADALKLRLIDAVAPVSDALAAIQKEHFTMTIEEIRTFAKANPDAMKEFTEPAHAAGKAAGIEEGKQVGKTEAAEAARPKVATASEIKAAFPEDRDFVYDRLEVDAPIDAHKIAYAEHLRKKLTASHQANDQLKARMAEIDPARAGLGDPLKVQGGGDDAPAAPSLERMNQLRKAQGLPPRNA